MAEKDEKTEKPTSFRLQKAKEKGDVPRSRELSMSVSLLMTVLFFALYVPVIGRTLIEQMRLYLGSAGERAVGIAALRLIWHDSFFVWLRMLGPLFALLIAVAFLMNVVQGGFRMVLEHLKFKSTPFKILSGLKRILVSPEALMELLKSMVKVAVIGYIAYAAIRNDVPGLLLLAETPLEGIMRALGALLFKVAIRIVVFLLALSVLDVLWTRWRHKAKLKMSKQEIKEEYKQIEGDPRVKNRRRAIQYQRAIQRMMGEVPKADVVITNPSHFAVALRYEYKKMVSPRLVAKGQDLVAERIKQVARENGVPVVENPPLARGLYGSVDVGEFIPGEFFKPVAEVLAYIYRLKGRRIG
jgi:flagellar biosynthesis protein FlhB